MIVDRPKAIPDQGRFQRRSWSRSVGLEGGVATSDIYTPGPNPDQGRSVIVVSGVAQTIEFTGLEPAIDLVAARSL